MGEGPSPRGGVRGKELVGTLVRARDLARDQLTARITELAQEIGENHAWRIVVGRVDDREEQPVDPLLGDLVGLNPEPPPDDETVDRDLRALWSRVMELDPILEPPLEWEGPED